MWGGYYILNSVSSLVPQAQNHSSTILVLKNSASIRVFPGSRLGFTGFLDPFEETLLLDTISFPFQYYILVIKRPELTGT